MEIYMCISLIGKCGVCATSLDIYMYLHNNKINARALIGRSAMFYCAGKPMEKSRVFWIII